MAKLKKTILVVEDDANARALLSQILEPAGFDVVEAENGLEALKRLQERPAHLILTDRDMPQMDGMGLLKKLREQQSAVPVLMISAYGEEALWSQAIGLGAKDYLLKPFKGEEVLAQIHKYLKNSK